MTSMKQALLSAGVVTPDDVVAAQERDEKERIEREEREDHTRYIKALVERTIGYMPETASRELAVAAGAGMITLDILEKWDAELCGTSSEDRPPRAAALWASFLVQHDLVGFFDNDN